MNLLIDILYTAGRWTTDLPCTHTHAHTSWWKALLLILSFPLLIFNCSTHSPGGSKSEALNNITHFAGGWAIICLIISTNIHKKCLPSSFKHHIWKEVESSRNKSSGQVIEMLHEGTLGHLKTLLTVFLNWANTDWNHRCGLESTQTETETETTLEWIAMNIL